MSAATPELKPCPFCGGEPLVGQTLDDAWYAMCANDFCAKLEAYWRTEAEAITAWNTRTPDLLALVKKMVDALELAANRLDRATVDAIASGDERLKCDLRDWSDEARATLTEATAIMGEVK